MYICTYTYIFIPVLIDLGASTINRKMKIKHITMFRCLPRCLSVVLVKLLTYVFSMSYIGYAVVITDTF